MSTEIQEKLIISPEDLELAEKFKSDANDYFKSEFQKCFFKYKFHSVVDQLLLHFACYFLTKKFF